MVRRLPLEAFIWLAALLGLAIVETGSMHFTLCPLSNAGFAFCPGCGLGRSVSLILHGRVFESFETHPLGLFAVVVLSLRILNLTKQYLQNYGKNY